MNNWKIYLLTAALLGAMSNGLEIHAQSPQPTPNSAKSSQNSDTRANKTTKAGNAGDVTASCSAAVEELKASRILIDALEIENRSLTERLATEKQTTAILTELNNTRRSESDALRNAIAAKNETITAKDAVITSQDKLVEALKKKKPSPWRRVGDILLGAAAIAVLK